MCQGTLSDKLWFFMLKMRDCEGVRRMARWLVK